MITFQDLKNREEKIAVVGLGYVGLPLLVHLSDHFDAIGFDLKEERVRELTQGHDRTREVDDARLASKKIVYSSDPAIIKDAKLIIVAVPTPIDAYRIPDLSPVESATKTVAQHIQKGTCVVFESTVYPGVTEDICVPILEKVSGLQLGKDFTVGYSPERINPGDKVHTLVTVQKIVAGYDAPTAAMLKQVYGSVVTAGIHVASSIRVAEAAKVIENTQRDINIALMNELAMIFEKMDIDTTEVLEAAGSKWNFLPFRPGLVGGHCIGVDPYYLTFKAESLGYHPQMILAGRRINDNMGKYVAERVIKMLINAGAMVKKSRVAVLGLTFKEDVPDLRNTKVTDIIDELQDYGVQVQVHDPFADPLEAKKYYGLTLASLEEIKGADAVVVAVAHKQYITMGLDEIIALCGDKPIIADIKALFAKTDVDEKIRYWRL